MLLVPYLVRRLWAHTLYLCLCPTSQCGPGHRNKTGSIELVPQVLLLLCQLPGRLRDSFQGKNINLQEQCKERLQPQRCVQALSPFSLSGCPSSRAGPFAL